jgi:CheY-like chemotaxis protein
LAAGLPAVRADDTQIGQVVMNLVMNAAEALGSVPGAVRVRTGVARRGAAELTAAQTQEPMPAGEYVFLEVEDEGCGMAPEVVDRIFDPFFTTKFTGRGLGLASVVGILRAHGGTIEVHSEVGAGTLMRVHLPALPGGPPAVPAAAAPAVPSGRALRVLVVDDEDIVRRVTARVLERAGHTVLQAAGGREALELMEDEHGRLDLVLLDLTMPGMDGAATLREIQFRWPVLRVVVMSGFAEQQAMERLSGLAAVPFLQKPLTPDTLLATVRAATLHSHT